MGLRSIAHFFFSLGGLGLFLLGVLDSSFLFAPVGNDLLIIALVARRHDRAPWYISLAILGSVIGVAIVHWSLSKLGKKGLEGKVKSRRIKYIERKVSENGGIAIGTAALMPPPFPFTPFIMAASALQYPRRKMLEIIAACRAVRFTVEGVLAVVYGRQIIRLAQNEWFDKLILALVALSIIGSAWSVYTWIRNSRSQAARVSR